MAFLSKNIQQHVRSYRINTMFVMLIMAMCCHLSYAVPKDSVLLANCSTPDTACIGMHLRAATTLTGTDYPKALEHAVSAVRLAEQADDYKSMIESYTVAGRISMYKGLLDLSVKFFTNQYNLAKKKEDEVETGMAYHNLGVVYLSMEDYPTARKYLNDSYAMLQAGYRKTSQSLPASTLLTFRLNMAIVHIYLAEYPSADSMLQLSMTMLKDIPQPSDKMMTLHHLWGLLYLKTKQPKAAFEALSQSRSIAFQLKSMPGVSASYTSEGDVFEEMGDTISAITSYTKALGYAMMYNGLSDQMGLTENLYKYYRKKGTSDSMVKYFDLFTELKAQSKAQQAREELMRTELMRNYDQMVKDWEEKQQPVRRQQVFLWAALALSLVIALVFFVRYRNQQSNMKFELMRRDLEERKTALEQLRFQAELNEQSAALETLKSRLNNQRLLEDLISGLHPSNHKSSPGGSGNSAKLTAKEQKAKPWEEFEYRFQQLHSGFYERLNQRFPELTINERRLCAFLKLDMTSKEISIITGQSVGAVNMARIRLRNKLGITHSDTELFTFLSEL